MPPQKRKRRPAETALPNVELQGSYHRALLLQTFRPTPATRGCVACNLRVTNSNLGGSDGNSAVERSAVVSPLRGFAASVAAELQRSGRAMRSDEIDEAKKSCRCPF